MYHVLTWGCDRLDADDCRSWQTNGYCAPKAEFCVYVPNSYFMRSTVLCKDPSFIASHICHDKYRFLSLISKTTTESLSYWRIYSSFWRTKFVKMMNTFVNMTNLRLSYGRWGDEPMFVSFWRSKIFQCGFGNTGMYFQFMSSDRNRKNLLESRRSCSLSLMGLAPPSHRQH
jgi:hypothetical protein